MMFLYGNDTSRLLKRVNGLEKDGYKKFFGNKDKLYSTLFSSSLFDKNNSTKYLIDLEANELKLTPQLIEDFTRSSTECVVFSTSSMKPSILKKIKNKQKFDIADNKKIFKFLDTVFLKKEKQSFELLNEYLDEGQEIYLTSMLFYVLKNILYFYYDKEAFNNLHSYVQEKTLGYTNKCSKLKASKMLFALSEADYKIKTSHDSKSVMFSLILYFIKI